LVLLDDAAPVARCGRPLALGRRRAAVWQQHAHLHHALRLEQILLGSLRLLRGEHRLALETLVDLALRAIA